MNTILLDVSSVSHGFSGHLLEMLIMLLVAWLLGLLLGRLMGGKKGPDLTADLEAARSDRDNWKKKYDGLNTDFGKLKASSSKVVAAPKFDTSSLDRKITSLQKELADCKAKASANVAAPAAAPMATKPESKELSGADRDAAKNSVLSTVGNAGGRKDDLKKISGVGPVLEGKLNEIGIFTFTQVSKMTKTEYDLIDALTGSFPGRAERDDWAGQARSMS